MADSTTEPKVETETKPEEVKKETSATGTPAVCYFNSSFHCRFGSRKSPKADDIRL